MTPTAPPNEIVECNQESGIEISDYNGIAKNCLIEHDQQIFPVTA